jgi:hypothetical protein
MKPGIITAALLLIPKLIIAQDIISSDIDVKAPISVVRSATVEDMYSEINHREISEVGVIGDWRERMYKIVIVYSRPVQPDQVSDYRRQSMSEIEERTSEGRRVTKAVLKETLKFAQERLPEIDRLVKILRFDVSTDMVSEIEEASSEEPKTPGPRMARQTVAENRFFMKTGLRMPVDGGKMNLLSETEASYGSVSSYFRVQLSGRYDSRLGLVYTLSRDMHVQVERQVNHSADAVVNERTKLKENMNLVQLVCAF